MLRIFEEATGYCITFIVYFMYNLHILYIKDSGAGRPALPVR